MLGLGNGTVTSSSVHTALIRLDTLEDLVVEEERTQKPHGAKREVEPPAHQRHIHQVDKRAEHAADVVERVEQKGHGIQQHIQCHAATPME